MKFRHVRALVRNLSHGAILNNLRLCVDSLVAVAVLVRVCVKGEFVAILEREGLGLVPSKRHYILVIHYALNEGAERVPHLLVQIGGEGYCVDDDSLYRHHAEEVVEVGAHRRVESVELDERLRRHELFLHALRYFLSCSSHLSLLNVSVN